MNAEQANYAATSFNENHNSLEFSTIIDKIKENSNKGLFSVKVKSISSSTLAKLKADGFKIIDCSDHRENYTEYSITW